MKTIGILGGMSWESSLEYYRIINELVKERLGGLHSAKILMYSFDFQELEELLQGSAWEEIAQRLTAQGRLLEQGGADCLLIATNTMHQVAPALQQAVSVPLIHIADAAGKEVQKQGLKKVGLLGTRFTMEGDFYGARLEENYGLEVITPPPADREYVNRVIFEELCLGELKDGSRQEYIRIIADMVEAGAQGVVLGCTEIPLLVKPPDSPAPLLDTTHIHAQAAVDFALS
jgi:aspartate racemase